MGFLRGFRRPKDPPPSPDEIAHAAAEAVIASLRDVGVTANLDYTEDSIFLLDELIAQGWPPPLRTDETWKLLPPTVGAYIGEVMVRHLGGSWTWGVATPVVRFRNQDIDPGLWVRRRLNGEHYRYIAMAFTALKVALGLAPDPRS